MKQENDALSKREKNVCLWIWGNVPIDVNWVRSSKLFQEKMAAFETHENTWVWPDVDVIRSLLNGSVKERELGERLNEIYGNPEESRVNVQSVKELFEWKSR